MNSRRRLILGLLASTAAFLGTAIPASADHSPEHASDQISVIASSAESEMDGIVSGFAAQAEGLSDEGEVDQSAEDATTSVEEVWSTARTAVDDLVKLFPGQLGKVGGDAKQQLQDARQAARSTISELADAWVPPIAVPSPTTTTTIPNSGTAPAEIDPGPGPGTDPGNGNANGNANGNGKGNGPDPGTDPAPGQVVGPPVDRSPSSSESPPAAPEPEVDEIGIDFELAAAAPEQPFTVSPEAITTLLAAEDTGATATMAEMLKTVLSPAVVDLVLSPLLVLEILFRTLVDGGLRLVGPLTLLVVSALAIFGYDRLSKRNLFPSRRLVGVDGLEPPTPAL